VIFPSTQAEKAVYGEELEGALQSQDEQGLSHSLVEGDQDKVEEGQLLDEAINQGMSGFNPDLFYQDLVNNYQHAENIYGESLIRLLTGEDPNALKKNIKFPEYKKLLKKKIEDKFEKLEQEGLIDEEKRITEKGLTLASLVLLMEELNELSTKDLGEKVVKQKAHYGEKSDTKPYRKGDRYKDITLKASIKKAIRRLHSNLTLNDLETFEKRKKTEKIVIYALDASGSMKGRKIKLCKKAGVALAFKAIQDHNKVGLIVFGSDIEQLVYPTLDFMTLVTKLQGVKAKKKTDLAVTIDKAREMFPSDNITKHLVLITDAVPTEGASPQQDTLIAIEKAKYCGITTSVVGVQIDEGEELAKKIVEIGQGRFYKVKDLENLDLVILEDYYSI